MNTASYIAIALFGIGISVLVFSIWSHILIRRHLRQFRNNHRFQSSLTDQHYFELKSRQEYIVAASAVIFSLITFLGFQSIKEIKDDLNKEMESERTALKKIRLQAQNALRDYQALDSLTGDYSDSVNYAFKNVSQLNTKINSIYKKNIIQQSIFITQRVNLKNIPGDKYEVRTVYFKDLVTISGERLPTFTTPPNIICTSNSNAWIFVSNVTTTSFKTMIGSSTSTEPITDEQEQKRPVFVEIWISSKPK
jgi:hypothetical protein